METTEFQLTTETKLKRIAWLSSRDKHKCFNNLMHLINAESLEGCFMELERKKAPGVDGISKDDYGEQLKANLQELLRKLKSMSYRPGNIREVKIPKESKAGEMRTLGISNFEDKLFQKMMHKVLESIYEPLFRGCSYGFRSGRGCHDAVKALRQHLYENEVDTVIDVDLANYFGTVDHQILLDILGEKISDKRLLRYIARLLKAGIMSEIGLKLTEEGLAQGSSCSPILANIFAHRVLDEWFEEVVKKHCRGKVELFRYCDDSVICCQYEEDAHRVRKALEGRLRKYGLKLNEDKTKLVNFGKRDGMKRKGPPEGFDFLGFTFYWGRARSGKPLVKVKSSGKRLRSKLVKVNLWAKSIRNVCKLKAIWKIFQLKIAGHIRYYGVSFNIRGVKRFIHRATRILFKWLNRRSQRHSFTWETFLKFTEINPLPKAKIWHKLY